MAAVMALARRHVGAGGRGVRHCGVAHAAGELWFGDHAFPRKSGCHRASGYVALRGDARGPTSFHPRLSRALAGASVALWR
jgi:hypothetical protein